MNAFNELVTTIVSQPMVEKLASTENFVKKEDLQNAINKLYDKLDSVKLNALNKKSGDIGTILRINRPLKWKYNWRGKKKYAVLDKEQLEYWNKSHMSWYPISHEEAGTHYYRFPGCWD